MLHPGTDFELWDNSGGELTFIAPKINSHQPSSLISKD
jgi:hypothetical protein